MMAMMYLVFDATLLCLRFVKELCRSSTEWPAETKTQFENRLGLDHQIIGKWIDLDFVAKRTRCISSLIYYPFILIALVILTRSTVFANYTPNLKILVFQGTCLTIVFGCAVALCLAAQSMRSAAKQKLMDGIISAKGPRPKDLGEGGSTAGQLETLLIRIDDLREGAFSPLSQQPLVRALLLPAGQFWLDDPSRERDASWSVVYAAASRTHFRVRWHLMRPAASRRLGGTCSRPLTVTLQLLCFRRQAACRRFCDFVQAVALPAAVACGTSTRRPLFTS